MSVKNTFLGFLAAVALFLGYHSYFLYFELKAGAQAYLYLAQPVATGSDGKPVTRAQVLDAFIAQAQRASQSQGGPSTSSDKNQSSQRVPPRGQAPRGSGR